MLESVREAAVSPLQQDQTADSGYQRKLKVLVLGRLFAHKGSDILQSSLGELREFAEIHLLGSGDEAIAVFENKVDTFQPHYEQDDLPQLVVDLAPDVAVMLSTVPETFSYTAEELQLMGIPLVTTAVGSLPERIDANRTGWHVEPTSESLVAELSRLQRNRALLSDARRQLRDQPRPFTAGEMVEQYKRYALPTERMPLRRAGTLQHSGVILDSDEIYVRPDIPVKQAVLAFLRWLRRRVAASPRLPSWLRRLLG
jgi:glycosyltransferase involved in cell wall biosynthesis